MTESHDYLSKARSLLDTAESYTDAGNHEAAELYRGRAYDIMAKFGIEEHMLAAKLHKDEKPIRIEIEISNPYGTDKKILLNEIGKALGTMPIWHARRPGIGENRSVGAGEMIIIGFESDLERVEILYTSLLLQAFSEMAKTEIPYGSKPVRFRKSFLTAFASTVSKRIQEAEERARAMYEKETGIGTALVVVDRADRIQASLRDLIDGRVQTSRRKLRGDGRGYLRGEEAGNRADIGQDHLGGQRPALNG